MYLFKPIDKYFNAWDPRFLIRFFNIISSIEPRNNLVSIHKIKHCQGKSGRRWTGRTGRSCGTAIYRIDLLLFHSVFVPVVSELH